MGIMGLFETEGKEGRSRQDQAGSGKDCGSGSK